MYVHIYIYIYMYCIDLHGYKYIHTCIVMYGLAQICADWHGVAWICMYRFVQICMDLLGHKHKHIHMDMHIHMHMKTELKRVFSPVDLRVFRRLALCRVARCCV